MTPQEQDALEGLIGRRLAANEIAVVGPLVEARNDVAIAAMLSVGRKHIVQRLITARGVRAALTVPEASRFLALLREADTGSTVPEWLVNVLADKTDVQVADYPAYLDMFACAHKWLQGAGLDLADPATRAGLGLIAESDQASFGGIVEKLLALAQADNPIPFDQVSAVLNKAQGLMTL